MYCHSLETLDRAHDELVETLTESYESVPGETKNDVYTLYAENKWNLR